MAPAKAMSAASMMCARHASAPVSAHPRVRLGALVLRLALACALCGLLCVPARAQAAILGDDYVGATTVTDRGLNVTEAPVVDAAYGILCDSEGTVLWSRDADTQTSIASITKVMTAIVALENASLDDVYTVSAEAASVGESSAGLSAGSEVSLETLLNAMLVHSGNDAAVAIAEGVGGDVGTFVEMMNEKAESMGLENTQFSHPSGLQDLSQGNYSTAADVCVMARYAMADDTFRSIVSQTSVKLEYGGKKHKLKSTNALLSCWEYCIGIKTGFTSAAGQCLASAARKDGLELYAVVLSSSDEVERFIDSYKLLDWGFAHYRKYTLASSDDVLVEAAMSGFLDKTVKAGVAEDISAYVLDYDGDISVDVKLVDISDGVQTGEQVGTIVWRQGETVVASAALVAKESIQAPLPWVSVFVSMVRLVGFFTGDAGMATSELNAQSIVVDMSDDTAGQIMDASVEKALRSYISNYE